MSANQVSSSSFILILIFIKPIPPYFLSGKKKSKLLCQRVKGSHSFVILFLCSERRNGNFKLAAKYYLDSHNFPLPEFWHINMLITSYPLGLKLINQHKYRWKCWQSRTLVCCDGNVKWWSCYGKQYGGSSTNVQIAHSCNFHFSGGKDKKISVQGQPGQS
jgi:hypothetical protein